MQLHGLLQKINKERQLQPQEMSHDSSTTVVKRDHDASFARYSHYAVNDAKNQMFQSQIKQKNIIVGGFYTQDDKSVFANTAECTNSKCISTWTNII